LIFKAHIYTVIFTVKTKRINFNILSMLINSMEGRKLHSILSSTAVRLSVYSAFLDFGLTLSVFILQSHLLPATLSKSLLTLFDTAIEYLTFAIISLFISAMVLRARDRIVTIRPNKTTVQVKDLPKLKVSLGQENLLAKSAKQGVIKVDSLDKLYNVERVVNSKAQNFIRFNGVWYKVTKDKFDKVAKPDYS
jgi:hypothetical protein